MARIAWTFTVAFKKCHSILEQGEEIMYFQQTLILHSLFKFFDEQGK